MNPALFSARDFSSHHIHPLDDVWHVCCHRAAGQWTCRHQALTCTEDVRTCVSRARVDVRLKLHPVAMSGKQLSCSSNRHPQPTTPQRIIRWHILAVQNFILIFYRVERKKPLSPPFSSRVCSLIHRALQFKIPSIPHPPPKRKRKQMPTTAQLKVIMTDKKADRRTDGWTDRRTESVVRWVLLPGPNFKPDP